MLIHPTLNAGVICILKSIVLHVDGIAELVKPNSLLPTLILLHDRDDVWKALFFECHPCSFAFQDD